jgi:hypothetical protein
MKLCNIYCTEKEHFVVCAHETVAGFHVENDPVRKISRTEPAEKLGATVLEVLNASTDNAPIPGSGEMKVITASFVKFAGAKSWKAFVKEAVSCGVKFASGGLLVTPNRRDDKGNYFPMLDHGLEVAASADAVGHGVLEALKQAT